MREKRQSCDPAEAAGAECSAVRRLRRDDAELGRSNAWGSVTAGAENMSCRG